MLIKICGLTTPEAVDAAAGADMVGFVFAPSPRRVSPTRARDLAARLPPTVQRVAVFQNASTEEIAAVCAIFPADFVQVEPGPTLPEGVKLLPVLHGAEVDRSPAAPLVVLEAAAQGGGTGETGDWTHAAQLARQRPIILAGGLCPDNVAAAIRAVRPAGVDVSSGVEKQRGHKDPQRIRAFIEAARAAARHDTSRGDR
jgi:phosphoribosylanthranilate isomerase